MDHRIIKYLKYSNVKAIFSLNPLHWNYIPLFRKNNEVWGEFNYFVSFLFLTITVFIDDGSW
jgi:hypothetical protein